LTIAAAGLYRCRRRTGGGLLVASALLAVAALALYPLYFQEVNASFAARSIDLDEVGEQLARWASWHWFRTAIGVGALAAAVLAVRDRSP
jgi:hypothetical protein